MQTLTLNVSSTKLLTYSGKLTLGQKWDNSVTKITFVVPAEYVLGNNYVILENPSNTKTIAIPLDKTMSFIISNGISQEAGEWKLLYLSCATALVNGNIPDVNTAVSTKISGYIIDNYITGSITGVMDENFTVLYNNLLNLKTQLETMIASGTSGVTTVDQLKIDLGNLLDTKLSPVITDLNSIIEKATVIENKEDVISAEVQELGANITVIDTNVDSIKTTTDAIKITTDTTNSNVSNILTQIGDISTIITNLNGV